MGPPVGAPTGPFTAVGGLSPPGHSVEAAHPYPPEDEAGFVALCPDVTATLRVM